MVDLYAALPPGADDPKLHAIAARFHMDVETLPPGPLPPKTPETFFNVLDPLTRALPEELGAQVRLPIWVDTVGRSGLMEIRVNLGGRVLRFITRRTLAYEPNVHIFILWMLGASLVLVTVAILFLRNQIRPILRLADAAEDFGKGRDAEFHPRGAREVRQAGYAFIEMKRRIERATEQRTAMLNGVSHDLRTMLTRFKLSLAVIDESAEVEPMQKDVDEMQRMLEGYLAFARGDAGEPTELTDLRGVLDGLRADAERHGARVEVEAKGDLNVRVRPIAIKRCLGNLVANAERHAKTIALKAAREQRFVNISSTTTDRASPPNIARTCSGRSSGSTKRATRTKAARASAWRSPATSRARTAARSAVDQPARRPARLRAIADLKGARFGLASPILLVVRDAPLQRSAPHNEEDRDLKFPAALILSRPRSGRVEGWSRKRKTPASSPAFARSGDGAGLIRARR